MAIYDGSLDSHYSQSVIRCGICGQPMKQSKNDLELYCCYQCGERMSKSDLKVVQSVIPKRENKRLNYGDEVIASIDQEHRIFSEPDVNIKSYSLLDQQEDYNVYSELELKTEIDKLKIKEQFSKMLGNKNIKIDFSH